ncbi:MAG TPA: preprotein translocase subunit SecY [Blastocatellia bacterium]|nr:preprotein translocase subunit SecY [Blastocatellia bacterium]
MIENFLNSIRNIFAVPELRRRVLFTLAMLAVYRIGSHVRTPGIDPEALKAMWDRGDLHRSLAGVMDLFSGGNFKVVSIFALGITPYITASIILQLMTVVSPRLKALQEEGEMGRRKITQYTRYLTVVLCSVQSFGIAYWLQNQQTTTGSLVTNPGPGFIAMTMLTLATGTTFIMWLGEQITERGVGNGISLIIFAGIVLRIPSGAQTMYEKLTSGGTGTALGVIALLIAMILIIAAIVFVERGFRKVPINHARRMVGRQSIPQQQTHMPLKVNMGGVIPVIFASSILAFPQTILGFLGASDPNETGTFKAWLARLAVDIGGQGHPLHYLIYSAAIIFFTFFYVSIIFNTDEVANNLRKNGAFIPGIRPGKRTADYLNEILTRLTTVGAIYLAAVALLPQFLLQGFQFQYIPLIGASIDSVLRSNPLTSWLTTGIGVQFYFGGTSLLILIGVAMDTMNQIESQLIMRHYDGFLGPRGRRLRGRRTM